MYIIILRKFLIMQLPTLRSYSMSLRSRTLITSITINCVCSYPENFQSSWILRPSSQDFLLVGFLPAGNSWRTKPESNEALGWRLKGGHIVELPSIYRVSHETTAKFRMVIHWIIFLVEYFVSISDEILTFFLTCPCRTLNRGVGWTMD